MSLSYRVTFLCNGCSKLIIHQKVLYDTFFIKKLVKWCQINKSGVILSQDKIELLYEKLYPLSQADNSLKMAHNENVQQKRSISKSEATDTSTASADSESICPRCGGHLVLRTANKGKHIGQRFYGCSNYPRCRYTSTIDGQ